ncbi:DUF1642 domain-containing protein [Enterococcus casseliflavus]|uniref:DUF1642 domain-containing protein n=1 Tax=Enterococcus casseliflavus TaxID=37734 RepID=UPI003D1115D5
MNKQELTEMVKNAEVAAQTEINLIRRYKDEDSDYQRGRRNAYRDVATWIKDLDKVQKVVVKKFVAEWFEEHKNSLNDSLWDLTIQTNENSQNKDKKLTAFEKWFIDFEYSYEYLIRMKNGYEVEKLPVFPLSQGDLVIRKGKHEAKIYIVESVDESGVLLVNGIKDEFYSVDDEGGPDNDLDYFYSNFRLLAKKESLEVEEAK